MGKEVGGGGGGCGEGRWGNGALMTLVTRCPSSSLDRREASLPDGLSTALCIGRDGEG